MKIEVTNKGYIEVDNEISGYELSKEIFGENYKRYLLIKVNNTLKELTYDRFKDGDKVTFLDITDPDGLRVYVRTLTFIYIRACKDVFNEVHVSIEHSLNKGLYSEIKLGRELTDADIEKIKDRMSYIIKSDKAINKKMLKVDEAMSIFEKQDMPDKIELLKHWNTKTIRVYEIEGYYDTFYGYLAPNTNVIDKYNVTRFSNGVILSFPTKENNFELPEYTEQMKLSKVFKEAEDWGDIMDVANVGALNNKIMDGSIEDLIRVNEALHEKKIAYIADAIASNDKIKVVLIAGPSSSGKTTFAQRLSIQLRVNGKKTYAVSLDDYFVNRDKTPRDEFGNYDFDTINALDLGLFNEQLLKLMNCEEVNVPVFNFKTGMREYTRKPVTLTKDHIIIVEGIHGLNDKLTNLIPQESKFRIYISALTQLNIDNHNRISTTDTRLIRRIVRDHEHRGHNAEKTMELWDNVGRGEERYIFPFQENADVMFNSSLTYEMGVLKKYAIPLIKCVPEESEFYPERQRLIKFLSYFRDINDEKAIPATSIIREFIGGSCFE